MTVKLTRKVSIQFAHKSLEFTEDSIFADPEKSSITGDQVRNSISKHLKSSISSALGKRDFKLDSKIRSY